MAALSLVFDIIGKDHASKTLDKVSGSAEKTGGHLKGLGKTAAFAFGGAALGGIAAFSAGLVGGFKEAVSYQKITDQLAQTIKATGGVAGVSVDGLKKYAGQLESLSGVDEELILSSQNVLATFTQIQNKTGKGNDIFNQASLAALNLSTTLGTDVNSAAVQVGKALNDPIKGITALSKAGVSFTQQQKDQIKTLVKSGNTLGAQKIILGELNKEFGGAAAAAGKGFGGTIARLKDTVSDAFRDIATRALPTLTKLADGLAKVLPGAIAFVSGVLGKFGTIVRQVFDVLFKGDFTGGFFQEDSKFVDILFRLRDGFLDIVDAVRTHFIPALVGAFKSAKGPVLDIVNAVRTNFVPVLVKAFNAIKGPAETVFGFLRDHAKPIIIALIAAIALVTAPVTVVTAALIVLYSKSQQFRDIIGSVADFIRGRVVPAFASIGDFITTKVLPALVRVGGFLVSTFTPTFKALSAFVTGSVLPAFRGLADRIRENQPMFEKIGKVIGVVAVVIGFLAAKILGLLLPILLKLAGFLLRTLFGAIGVVIGIIARFVAAIAAVSRTVGNVIGFVRDHWKLLLGILTGPIGAAVIFITTHFDTIVSTVKGLPGRIKKVAGGMFDGIKDAFRASINWIITAWNGLEFKLPTVDTHIPGVGKVGGFTLGTPDIKPLRLGGRVAAGMPYLVGDGGRPELFVPDRGGRVEPRVPASGGLTIQGNVILQKAEPETNSQALTRGLRNLAFTMGV